MIFQGNSLSVQSLGDGIAELKFDLAGESVNKFNRPTIEELGAAVAALNQTPGVKALIVTSGKAVFIVGADITEFGELFKLEPAGISAWSEKTNAKFSAFEDLPFPTVCAINGIALGGGLEMALSCDYRVMSSKAEIGLPEVKLGLFPGFGGTVRFPRVAGVDKALEWIGSGAQKKAAQALADHAVDAVVEPEQLRDAALAMAKDAANGKIDWRAKRQLKLDAVPQTPDALAPVFQTALTMIEKQTGGNYPAPVAAAKLMQKSAFLPRDAAIRAEAEAFGFVAKTDAATALVGIFLNDQALKKAASRWEKQSKPVTKAAVLGAGIMGGGIAFQSASRGTPIVMKDIAEKSLELGLSEARKLLAKRVETGKIKQDAADKVLASITPTLTYSGFNDVDIVVEAVVEKEAIKKSVLAEVEAQVKPDAVLASNTSTISISRLASALQRPEKFVGMHFFNPVHAMQLVEVIRGEKSSDAAVAVAVAWAKKMGKSPVVVNDCPGFYVNRVLFPYLAGFNLLLRDGADFQAVDHVAEQFGWPMGPAYLMDVVGIDTSVHAASVLAAGIPERMNYGFKDAATVLFEQQRFGQKNGDGFYTYAPDAKGKPRKTVDEKTYALIAPVCAARKTFSAEETLARLMLPMCNEVVRCLEEGIVANAADADMALLYGVGFPAFRGGALRWMQTMGLPAYIALCDRYAHLGKVYEPTEKLRAMAKSGEVFFR